MVSRSQNIRGRWPLDRYVGYYEPYATSHQASTRIKHFGSISGMPPSRSPRLSLLNVRDSLPIPGGTLVEAQPK